MTKLQLKILELENQEIKSTICALNKNLSEAKKMLADNQPLVSSCTQLSKLKSISKRPSSLAEDRFYAMAQSVIPKSLPKANYLGGVLIIGGLLASFGINDNQIVSGIPNYITSP